MLQLKNGGSTTCDIPAIDHKSRKSRGSVFKTLTLMIKSDKFLVDIIG
jgi:hypothetical protein